MQRSSRLVLAGTWILPLAIAYLSPASAVPMWSRRYGVSCTTCHSYPSLPLTSEGLDFFRRGHRFDPDSLDRNFGNLISAHGEWNYELQDGAASAFPSPEFHFHAGVALSPLFSTYVDANVNSDFKALFVQLTKSFGPDSYFTARQGKISPTIIRNYGNGLMASSSRPLILSDATLGQNPFTPARESYGLDLGGRWKQVFAQAGVLNGGDIPGQAAVGNHKDVFGSVELNPMDNPSGLGLYYYRGGYDLTDAAGATRFDRYQRVAVFANCTRERMRPAGAYLHGTDVAGELPARAISGYYVQMDDHPGEWVTPFARYDWSKREIEGGEDRVHVVTVGAAVPLYETDAGGGRAVLELSRRKQGDAISSGGSLDLLWAF